MTLLDLLIKISCDDKASEPVNSLADSLKGGLATAAKTAVAGVAAVTAATSALVGSALSAYSSYEQLVGGVDKLYGEASGKLQAYAANAYATAGMSANQYMEQATSFSASLISSLGGDVQAAADLTDVAMRAMSDNVNVFGSNMTDVQNAFQGFAKQNYTMLDNLKLGYGGTQEEMKRLIQDAAALTDVQSELGLTVDANSMSFDNIVKAIQVMQTEMGIAGTTSMEAAQTIEGSITMMKASWENWIAGLGNEKADMSALTEQLLSSIDAVVTNVAPRVAIIVGTLVTEFVNAGPQVAQALGTMLSGAFSDAFDILSTFMSEGGIEGALAGFMTFVQNGIMQLAEQLPTAIETVVPVVMQAITTAVTGILTNLPAILMALIPIAISALTAFAASVAEQLPTTLTQIATAAMTALNELVTNLLTNLPTYVGQMVQAALQLFQGIVDAIPQVIPVVVSGIGNLVQTVLTNLPSYLGAMISAAVTLFNGIVSAIPQVLPAVLSGIGSLLQDVWNTITSFDLVGAGVDLIQGLINGIASMGQAVIDAIGGVVGDAIDWAKGMLGIASPSKLFKQFGVYTMEGYNEGLEAMASDVEGTMESIMDIVAAVPLDYETDARLAVRSLPADGEGSSPKYGNIKNEYNFYNPVKSPYETARAIRMQQTYGLAGAR